jgi:hypothetical protein
VLHRYFVVLSLALTLAVAPACAGHRAPILVGQSALAAAQGIERLSDAGKQLEEAAVLPTAVALNFQKLLLSANDRLKPLPDILRTIDRLQQAGETTGSDVDKAIAILTVVGQDISVVIQGVPLSDATARLIELTRAAQQTVQTILVEVSKIRGREQ